jgi:hypothetical protein
MVTETKKAPKRKPAAKPAAKKVAPVSKPAPVVVEEAAVTPAAPVKAKAAKAKVVAPVKKVAKREPGAAKKSWQFFAGDVVDYTKNGKAHRCTVVTPRGAHVNVRFEDGRCQDVIKKRLVHV